MLENQEKNKGTFRKFEDWSLEDGQNYQIWPEWAICPLKKSPNYLNMGKIIQIALEAYRRHVRYRLKKENSVRI